MAFEAPKSLFPLVKAIRSGLHRFRQAPLQRMVRLGDQAQAPWWVWMMLLGLLVAMAWLTTPQPSYAESPRALSRNTLLGGITQQVKMPSKHAAQLALAEETVFMAGVQVHHAVLPVLFLGDGHYSERSAHARYHAQGVQEGLIEPAGGQGTCAIVATLPHTELLQHPWVLHVDSIRGLDTPEAHAAGQSQATTMSTPATVWVNDKPIGEMRHNNQPYAFPLKNKPESPHNGNPNAMTTVSICTGQRIASSPTEPIDRDDIQVMGVRVVRQ